MIEDFCFIQVFDYVEFYVGNVKQVVQYYECCFGFINIYYKGFEMGECDVVLYIMDQGVICFILMIVLFLDYLILYQVYCYGDGVGCIGLWVLDVCVVYIVMVE